MVTRCLEEGLQVLPFTVNDSICAKRLIKWGVEYIISDIPNGFLLAEV